MALPAGWTCRRPRWNSVSENWGSISSDSGERFTETDHIAISVLDVEVEARPRSFFEGFDDLGPTRLQFLEQLPDARHGDVRIQVLILFPVRSFGSQFRRVLEVYRESVAADARVERLVREVENRSQAGHDNRQS